MDESAAHPLDTKVLRSSCVSNSYRRFFTGSRRPKGFYAAADPPPMISSISNTHANNVEQSTAPKSVPQPQTQQKSTLPQDTVKLSSTPSAEPGGDSK
jgi:hypothetical protein